MENPLEITVSRRTALKVGAGLFVVVRNKLSSGGENPVTPPQGIKALDINGVQILKSGKEGPNIIFLHNAGQVPLGMTEHILNLSEAGQVIAPNIFDLIRSLQLQGNENPTFADIAHEIYRLDILDKKQKTGLVTNSFGGSVGWEYNAQHPQEVEWNVAGSPTGWPLKRSLIEWMVAFVREFILPPNPKIPQNLRKRDPGSGLMVRRFRENPRSVVHGLKLAMNADEREAMKTIKTPVDLLWGRADKYIPPWTQEMILSVFPTNGSLGIVSAYNHLWLAVEPEKLTDPAVVRAKATPR